MRYIKSSPKLEKRSPTLWRALPEWKKNGSHFVPYVRLNYFCGSLVAGSLHGATKTLGAPIFAACWPGRIVPKRSTSSCKLCVRGAPPDGPGMQETLLG